MKENRTLVIAMSFAALIIMSVTYAAFANVITITANSTAAGMGSVTWSANCGNGTAGVSGAGAPVATPTFPDDPAVMEIRATLHQPNDTVTCTITWTNNTPFTVKTTKALFDSTCAPKEGTISAPITIGIFSDIPAGTTLAPGSSITDQVIFRYYAEPTQGDPTTKTASIKCSLNWVQA